MPHGSPSAVPGDSIDRPAEIDAVRPSSRSAPSGSVDRRSRRRSPSCAWPKYSRRGSPVEPASDRLSAPGRPHVVDQHVRRRIDVGRPGVRTVTIGCGRGDARRGPVAPRRSASCGPPHASACWLELPANGSRAVRRQRALRACGLRRAASGPQVRCTCRGRRRQRTRTPTRGVGRRHGRRAGRRRHDHRTRRTARVLRIRHLLPSRVDGAAQRVGSTSCAHCGAAFRGSADLVDAAAPASPDRPPGASGRAG